MKKLIAISVVFALVAGVAFAEINVGGAVMGKVNVLEGSSQKDIYDVPNPNPADTNYKGDTALNSRGIFSSGGLGRIRLDGSGQSEDGTFGGYLRIDGKHWSGNPKFEGHAWWKPIDQFKLTIGENGDGFYGKDGVARWGFYRDGNEVGITPESWAFGASFFGGFDGGGATLTITPLELLEINVSVPFFDGGRAEKVFKSTIAQVALNIDGIGTAAITYKGGYEGDSRDKEGFLTRNPKASYSDKWPLPALGYAAGTTAGDILKFGKEYVYDIKSKEGAGGAGAPKIFAYFDLGAIENLGIQLGVGFTMPRKYEDEKTGLNQPGKAAVAPTAVVNPAFDPTQPVGSTNSPLIITAGTPAVAADPTQGTWTTKDSLKYNTPLAVGLGVSFDSGAFGIKARVQGEFAEKFTWERTHTVTSPGSTQSASISREFKGPFVLTADILPSFAINDSMKVFLSAGLKLQAGYDVLSVEENPVWGTPAQVSTTEQWIEVTKAQDSVVGWHIMPYFSKSVGWCQAFYAGFRIFSDGSKWTESYGRKADGTLDKKNPNEKTIINWEVPIGIAFQF